MDHRIVKIPLPPTPRAALGRNAAERPSSPTPAGQHAAHLANTADAASAVPGSEPEAQDATAEGMTGRSTPETSDAHSAVNSRRVQAQSDRQRALLRMQPPPGTAPATPQRAVARLANNALEGTPPASDTSSSLRTGQADTAQAQAHPPLASDALRSAQHKRATLAHGNPVGLRTKVTLALTAFASRLPGADMFMARTFATARNGRGPQSGPIQTLTGSASVMAPPRSASQNAVVMASNAGPNDAGDLGDANDADDANDAGEKKPIDAFNDLGNQWIGESPETGAGDPTSFLARFTSAEGGEFVDGALKAYGCLQAIEAGLAKLKGSSRDQAGYQAQLQTVFSNCGDVIKLLCGPLADKESIPAVSDLNLSMLAEVDALLKASGNDAGRLEFLKATHQTYAAADTLGTLRSMQGKMLNELLAPIMQELTRHPFEVNSSESADDTRATMKEVAFPLLHRLQKMHEKEAGLASLAGNHAQAASILNQCIDTVLSAKLVASMDTAVSDAVTLNFDLLKSQLLANDEESIGTMEILYMQMKSYAEEYGDRFPKNYPPSVFSQRLEDAYDAFLSDVEKNRLTLDLRHPIATLFIEAEERGVFGGFD